MFFPIYKSIRKKQRTPCIITESTLLYMNCADRGCLYDSAFDLASSDILYEDSTYFPETEPWILRNITTKKFIRSEAITIKPEYIHSPFIDYLGFREVIVLFANSPGQVSGVEEQPWLSRGAWAGHRFDITTLAKHNLDTQAAEWKT